MDEDKTIDERIEPINSKLNEALGRMIVYREQSSGFKQVHELLLKVSPEFDVIVDIALTD